MTEPFWLKSYPDGVKATLDGPMPASLVELFDDCFGKFAERTAVNFDDVDITYQFIDISSKQFAAYLQGLGLKKGDRVAVMLPNLPYYPIAVAGILRAGLVVVNINPLYTARELRHQLVDSTAKAIFALNKLAPVLEECIAETSIEHVILGSIAALRPAVSEDDGDDRNSKLRFVSFSQALYLGSLRSFENQKVDSDDIAVLQYTGGTTGTSKGSVLLHRNLVANVFQNEAWLLPAFATVPLEDQKTTACILPLYHILAFIMCLVTLRMGGKNVLISNPRDVELCLKVLRKHRIHFLPGLNTLFNGLMSDASFDDVDWSHLRVTCAGGMPTHPSTARRWEERTGCPVAEGYGLSEAAGTVTCNPPVGRIKLASVGLPLPSTIVQLLDDKGVPVAQGQVGQIALSGPQMMRGYWGREEDTRSVFTEEGFFLTGDMGLFGEDGYLQIVDRQKDMVLVSGFNVYPSEIEQLVTELSDVAECAVVGVADDATGEAVCLFIVRRNADLTEDDVRAHCRHHLTGYKQPKIIRFLPSLPKSPVGKILKKDLRALTDAVAKQYSAAV